MAKFNSALLAAMAEATNLSDHAAFTPSDFGATRRQGSGWLAFLEGAVETTGAFVPDARFIAPMEPQDAPPANDQHTRIAEAFERGLAQGRAEALAAAQTETGERRKLGISLRVLEGELRDHFAAMLAETIKALCGASFAPIALDTAMLQARCARAAAMLEDAQESITLRLSPPDIARLDPDFAAAWTIAPDPDLPQGELRAEGRDGAVLDGPREWARALAEALETC